MSSTRDTVTKKYSNNEITVVWKPNLCAHSSICWKGLHSVFNPQERPWIKMEGATTEQIAAQVEKCPSGALSYYRNDKPTNQPQTTEQIVVTVQPNGPLVVTGCILVKLTDGTEVLRETKTSLCRCGQSNNKPFCDGTHNKVGFTG